VTALALVCLLLTPSFAAAQEGEDPRVASAKQWLRLVDAGNYSQSWEESGEEFKGAVTRETWEQQLTVVRSPMGAVVSRELNSTQPLTDPPSAPPGEYLVIRFSTSFEEQATATETVVLAQEGENDWKVAGYFIQ
jgi:hypothetical protein